MDTPSIQKGTKIRYRLRVHRIPIYWTSEITRWTPPYRFVDVQRSGPYRLWHHTHRFEADNGGTKISDVVRYAPRGVSYTAPEAWGEVQGPYPKGKQHMEMDPAIFGGG